MGYGPGDLEELYYLSYPILGGLDTAVGAAKLILVTDRDQPAVVIIDTLARAVVGEENSNDTWNEFYKHTGLSLKQRGIACLRLDHSGKDEDKGMRGGSAKYGDVDAVWQMRTVTENTLTLKCTHRRMRVAEELLTIHRLENPLRHEAAASGPRAAWDAKVSDAMTVLDQLGVPRNAGEPACRDALRETDHKVNNDVLRAAIRDRKAGIWTRDEEAEGAAPTPCTGSGQGTTCCTSA